MHKFAGPPTSSKRSQERLDVVGKISKAQSANLWPDEFGTSPKEKAREELPALPSGRGAGWAWPGRARASGSSITGER